MEIDGKIFIFESKPRHVTPLINYFRKTSPVLRVSTHICGVAKEIDRQHVHFSSKPRHVTPEINRLRKMEPCAEGFNTHLWHVSREINGKMFIF